MMSVREDRAEREAEQLRELLGVHGVQPQQGPPKPLPVRPLDPDLEAIYARVLTKATKRQSPAARIADTFRRHRAWAAIATATAALAAVAIIAAQVLNIGTPAAQADTPAMLDYEHALSSDPENPVGVPAADDLDRLSQAASKQPVNVPPAGNDWQHVSYLGWYYAEDNAKSAVLPTQTNTWLGPDGSFTSIEQRSETQLDSHGKIIPADQRIPNVPPTSVDTSPAGTYDGTLIQDLSRDPNRLRQQLLEWNHAADWDKTLTTETEVLFNAVNELSQFYVVPADLNAAIWTMLAREPGLRSLGQVTNRQGTQGIAIADWANNTHGELGILLVSPITGSVQGTEIVSFQVKTDSDQDDPVVIEFRALQNKNWVTGPREP